jgi:polyisoprenoid-binding protein YceI
MKNQTMKIAAILFLALAIVSCKKAKNETEATVAEEVAEVTAAATYTANAEVSTITWKGFKPASSHNGAIKISEGSLALEDGKLVGGNFIIDMNSITNNDIENAEYNAKLVGHLKAADFFDVEKHSFSAFTITGVEDKDGKTMVKGNLSIKGIKKNIEFPATVNVNGDAVSFTSEAFNIDRTEWGIEYNSGKLVETLKDKVIKDNIELSFDVKANKATL